MTRVDSHSGTFVDLGIGELPKFIFTIVAAHNGG